ncbi:MAG: hypothetical protein ACFFCS_20545 [Candidatus Hodarchaeota archaeon]
MAEAAETPAQAEKLGSKARQKKVEDETMEIIGFLLEMQLKETAMSHKIAKWERKISEIQDKYPGYYS